MAQADDSGPVQAELPLEVPRPPDRVPPHVIPPGCARILLSRGKTALVDQADYVWLSWRKWSFMTGGYAVGSLPTGQPLPAHRKSRAVTMHRVIMGVELLPRTQGDVDHWNGDKLDNRRANLRYVSHADNGRNRSDVGRGAGGHRGVWQRADGLWEAGITVAMKRIILGHFRTIQEAIQARRVAEKVLLALGHAPGR